jgi:DNA uptake protein ComE-like DNA-binding protein
VNDAEAALLRLRANRAIAALLAMVYIATAAAWWRGAGESRTGAVAVRWMVAPNLAGAEELELLPGIGPVLARRIVSFRESAAKRPAFAKPDDLIAVQRIGPITVERLRPFLTFASPAAPQLAAGG